MKQKFEKKQLIKKSENFSQWYIDVIQKAKLADYAPVKGCQVIRPYGFAIWENIRKILDEEIKKTGAKNAYFPLFIPEKFLRKEKEHIKGFSPELAVVTIGGGKKLKEKLIVRPTSETIIYEMYAKWIKSWRDLPLRLNQWSNIVRWEKRPRLFLRTTEFLWQEGHTVHSVHGEAIRQAEQIMKIYVKLYQDYFAIAGYSGVKSEAEKFPGALTTYTYEMLMPDGKALQGCTSHDLGQNFAKPFNIKFLGKDGKEKIPWQTSWGLTTRSIGALIMAHGDDSGLVLPPKLAPVQIVIIPIFQGKTIDKNLLKKAKQIEDDLKDFRVETDIRREYTVGWKYNDWELKGVPLRVEVGPEEIKNKKATLVRRDNRKKSSVSFKFLASTVKEILESIQKDLLKKSRDFLRKNTREVFDYKEFKDIMKKDKSSHQYIGGGGKGFLKAFWCGNPKCEAKIKEQTKATIRCLPLENQKSKRKKKKEKGKCIYCGKPAKQKWIFAQAY